MSAACWQHKYPTEKDIDTATITREEVLAAQKRWADSITNMSKLCLGLSDQSTAHKHLLYVLTKEYVLNLYAFDCAKVLFKPTKAAKNPFRQTLTETLSYFIGAKNILKERIDDHEDDEGFVINQGHGYKHCEFENNSIVIYNNVAIAMGTYYFHSNSNVIEEVQFTFGYLKCQNGFLKIFLHHSSLPYQ